MPQNPHQEHFRTVEIDKSASHAPRPLQNLNFKYGFRIFSTNLLRHVESSLSETFDKTGVIEIGLYSEGNEDSLSPLGSVAIFHVL